MQLDFCVWVMGNAGHCARLTFHPNLTFGYLKSDLNRRELCSIAGQEKMVKGLVANPLKYSGYSDTEKVFYSRI